MVFVAFVPYFSSSLSFQSLKKTNKNFPSVTDELFDVFSSARRRSLK